MNNGFTLYKDIINPYPPLFTGFLATFSKIFGYSPLPYQYLTWILILLIDFLVFFISQKIFKKFRYSFFSLIFFSIVSIPFSINGLWFDLVQTLPILLAVYYFYKFTKEQNSDKLFFSILFLTLAFFIKQQTIWLLFWFMAILIFKFRSTKDIIFKNSKIFLPFFILLIIPVIIFAQKNLLKEYLFWNYYFPFFQASSMPGYILIPTAKQLLVVISLPLFFLPLIFKKRSTKFFLGSSFVSFLFAYPRFDYFHLVPALAIMSIVISENFKAFAKSQLSVKLIFLISLIFLSILFTRYLARNWTSEIRFFEKDITQTARFIQNITDYDETIYIQNGPDQLFPLANRIPPKPWADEFPWYLEIAGLQDRVISGISQSNPRFIVFKPYTVAKRYEIGAYTPEKIANYIEINYQNLYQISESLWLKIKK
ncbi:glycosyltransferase family 39 protein [Candidatus Curtissbacteria bacterium]|nr:glycosyltransferase family 39 protein [Candidatus Curtissbacteria bacterium]